MTEKKKKSKRKCDVKVKKEMKKERMKAIRGERWSRVEKMK